MRAAACMAGLAALLSSFTLAYAQGGGKPVSGGNPTPGTSQPDPPNLSDRVTLSGCLQPTPGSTSGAEPLDTNTPSASRFVLSGARPVDRLPPGTGGSDLATKTSSASFRLEGLDSQFSPFVNTKVEISGEIRPRSPEGGPPTLLVEFVQKIANRC